MASGCRRSRKRGFFRCQCRASRPQQGRRENHPSERYPHDPWGEEKREGNEGKTVSSRRAVVRVVPAFLHPPQFREERSDRGFLRERGSVGDTSESRGTKAEADRC